jgi:hypothetical protein
MTAGLCRVSDSLASPAARLDTAARLLFEVIVTEGQFRLAGRAFLTVSTGLDRPSIVRAAALRLRAGMTNRAPQSVVEAVIWDDLHRLFRWDTGRGRGRGRRCRKAYSSTFDPEGET